MDRVAQLAEEADAHVLYERIKAFDPKAARKGTIWYLQTRARELGFPELEISAAIDTALKGR